MHSAGYPIVQTKCWACCFPLNHPAARRLHKKRSAALGGFVLGAMLIGACAASPTGRGQLQVFSAQQLTRMGKVSSTAAGRETRL